MSVAAEAFNPAPNHLSGFRWSQHTAIIAGIAMLLAASTWLIHATGGIDGPYTYVLVVPLLASAAIYGLRGGVAAGILCSILIGPYLPASDSLGLKQPIETWFVSLAVFLLVGGVAGGWNDRLRRQAQTERATLRVDKTTGLLNQAAFMEDLDILVQDHEGKTTELAAILVRATDLTDIVDVTGVDGGERFLRVLSDHVTRVCPEVKGTYRFSASELALVVETKDRDELRRCARTLHGVASSSFEIDGVPMRIEPALGLGYTGHDTLWGVDELVRRARVALRRAVSLERDWVSYEPALDSEQPVSVELIGRAEAALEAGEFELHYQPKIGLVDGRPIGTEALARWQQPGKGIVPPGSFMPKLERTSLIDAFSRFVMRTATDFAHRGTLVPVSINLAPRNLTDDALISALIDGLRQTNTSPELFEVEVTESALMREPEHAIASLTRLRAEGIGVSIDDFGTGYASFSYLRRLPATNMKIDRSFVRPIEGDAKTARLVLAMVEAGHALGLTVTAEGIETTDQARILAEIGCDSGQGFLWSPALPEAELCQWLEIHESASWACTKAPDTGYCGPTRPRADAFGNGG